MAGLVVALNTSRGALELCKIETGIVELILPENCHVPMNKISQAGQRVYPDFRIVRTTSKLIGGFGKEYRWTGSGIYLYGTPRVLIEWGPLLIIIAAFLIVGGRMAGAIVGITVVGPTAQSFPGNNVESALTRVRHDALVHVPD